MDDLEIRFRCLELAVKAHAANGDFDIVSLADSFYTFAAGKGSTSRVTFKDADEIPF